MSNAIPDWFWIFFTLTIIVLCGIGYQLHRIERKLDGIWRLSRADAENVNP
jgi:hypothetical protein